MLCIAFITVNNYLACSCKIIRDPSHVPLLMQATDHDVIHIADFVTLRCLYILVSLRQHLYDPRKRNLQTGITTSSVTYSFAKVSLCVYARVTLSFICLDYSVLCRPDVLWAKDVVKNVAPPPP